MSLPDHDRIWRKLSSVRLRWRCQRRRIDERWNRENLFVFFIVDGRQRTPDVQTDPGHVLTYLVADEALVNAGILKF